MENEGIISEVEPSDITLDDSTMVGKLIPTFLAHFDLTSLKPAEYNPRIIDDESYERLKQSIEELGTIKPILVNKFNNTIVAGHQRTRALLDMGITDAPVMLMKEIPLKDEARFNQYHNAVETNAGKAWITQPENLKIGFNAVAPTRCEHRGIRQGEYLKGISQLLTKYGVWGNVIVDDSGKILVNADYAIACKNLNLPILVYRIENSLVADLKYYFAKEYGEYCYANLPLHSFHQTYCQPHRLTKGAQINSVLYRQEVVPRLDRRLRYFDFGAGEAEAAAKLKSKGYNIRWYEPFPRIKGSDSFNIKDVVKRIRLAEFDIRDNGLYDFVILDSVINSVINPHFEHTVVTACNAMCAADATFVTATRNEVHIKGKTLTTRRHTEFYDKEGFSGSFRQGVWTMQKFHNIHSLKALMLRYFDEVEIAGNPKQAYIYAICHKPKDLGQDVFAVALEDEFNFDYPNGYKHEQHHELVAEMLRRLAERGGTPANIDISKL